MSDGRPTPEKLLARIQEEKKQRGKLKIYLGAAPGVGKTHTMLQDALAKREQGIDVMAGVVESHGRKEIDAMLQHFEILPRRLIEYHAKPLLEFDLDGALSRKPSLILIDEMAHMNVPGLRHAKRWQDIKELLDRGIDVCTTVNVQHIESLNDIVAQIIGIRVRETVPDSMLVLADTIELIDLPPDDLLRRLQEGKVYIPAQAHLASQNFFRKGNLIALRELALRFTAERVDEQILQHRKGEGIEQTWPTVERLLVCVGNGESGSKVIRAARRMAAGLHAEWIAVHVDTPRSANTGNHVTQNLRLAEQLGAETRILVGIDIVKEILIFARYHNVTKIIFGKHIRSRWRELVLPSLSQQLIRLSGEIDIYLIRTDENELSLSKPALIKSKSTLLSYGIAFAVIVVASIINLLIFPFTGFGGLINLIMIYLVGVVIVALRGQLGPSILASVLSAIGYTYFFIPSKITLSIIDFQYLATFIIMVMVAQIISHLTILTRQQAQIASISEQRTAALHALTRQLASTRGIAQLLNIGIRYISEVFNSEVIVLLYEDNELKVQSTSSTKKVLNAKELAVAQWVYDMGQIAGLGTDTLPFSDSLYVPLLGTKGVVGVFKIHPRDTELLLIPEQLHLLESCANQIALALEVDRLQDKERETEITIQTERLRAALFSSLSHELQNPLAMIVRLINKITKKSNTLGDEEKQQFVRNIYHEAERLNRLINNLLQITQLEEGKVQLHKKLYAIDEVVNEAFHRIKTKLKNRECILNIEPSLPSIRFDKVLIEQVLVNFIENAILYTPTDTPIEIAVCCEGNNILFSVADRGSGLMMTDIYKVFEKFYRGENPLKKNGAGLGLSVCQSIVKAHNGKIWAENRKGGGAIFYFILPLHE